VTNDEPLTKKTNPMKKIINKLFASVSLIITVIVAGSASAATRYVWQDSPSPGPPYTNWLTAATNIQDAVDAALAGDEIMVTNGLYATGGRAVGTNLLVNRVAVDKPLALRSVKGPKFTTIRGYQVPGTTNGDGAIRCVYLASGASLSGFTLTNGATQTKGDYYLEQSGGGVWCESTNALVSHCVVAGNSAAGSGGGASGGTLNNCVLTGNSATSYLGGGGGAYGSTLNHCTLAGNSGFYGGGAADSMLNNCVLSGNSASYSGGGASGGTLNNCTLTGNSAASYGGGAGGGTLNNCTLTGNSAPWGGGFVGGTLNNCIVYFNTAPRGANYFEGFIEFTTVLNHCCTTPMPTSGVGNITLDPQLASVSHLSAASPCRGAGSAAYTTGTDIDGEAWATPPSIGCDEYRAGAVTGPLSVGIVAAYTNVAVGFPVDLTALIGGHASVSAWEFRDGMVVSNRPYATHAWALPGDYAVVLRAYNESNPGGVSATVAVHVVSQPVHYVAAGSASPLSLYTSWATAANNIQDAVDVASVPGALVLVTNGTYGVGGRAGNRLMVDRSVVLRSVNGPEFTLITGSGTTRCVYLTNAASLSGFTLTNGVADNGGGLWCERTAVASNCVVAGNSANSYGGGAYGGTLNNCTLTGNSASGGGGASDSTLNNCTMTGNSAGQGGGASWGTLNNCTLTSNSAYIGGGTAYGTMVNCTLTANSAGWGGGATWGRLVNCTLAGNSATNSGGGVASCDTLENCIIYFNTAPDGANYLDDDWIPLNYCCTTPVPTNGVGNITNAPLFVDYAGGNLRLQSNSPCINAGRNAHVPGPTDLDGNPRIVRGTVDIGAYEFQGPGSLISYAWLQHYGLPTDGSADATDPDTDGHNTWQEWRCLTDPTNALSALRLLSAAPAGTNVTVSWQSVAGVSYFLERSTNLWASPHFTLLAPNLPGQPGTTSFMDTNAVGLAPLFYRLGVAN
jgi:hypothetical protein